MVKVLSLFDGMACGYLAFDSAGLKINQYDAFEIDEYAVKLSSHNYPDIVHHGNVFQGDFSQFEGYDYLIGGSPCTYWSIAQLKDKRERTARPGLGFVQSIPTRIRSGTPALFHIRKQREYVPCD